MAWIRMLDEEEVAARGGRLARLYRGNTDPEHGTVDNVLKIHSLRPETLDGHARLYHSVMHDPGRLDAADRETLAVLVSAANHCVY
ncbi:MAG: carboxymuconolactone decarboxylase family protein [Myxococcales bacterium]|nr:carboxymuconolactone decarboxylase family protein [Myxococcales bacterium]